MKPLAFPLLRLLADGQFHSGTAMAHALGVSRSTVCETLRSLGSTGPEVFSVRGKGYRLAQPLAMLDAVLIRQALCAADSPLQIEVADCVVSTNTCLMQKADMTDIHGHVLIAEMQTHGRGRRGKEWASGMGGSITLSLGWRFEAGVSHLAGLSLAIGVGLVRAMNDCGLSDVRLKWPNDILHGYRKLAGILTEAQGDMLGPCTAVVGVGVNVDLPLAVRDRVDQAVTDMRTAGATSVNRNEVIAVILKNLLRIMDGFATGGFETVRDEWLAHDAYAGKPVNILLPSGITEKGLVAGVDTDGALLVNNRHGVKRFNAGEISMRGES